MYYANLEYESTLSPGSMGRRRLYVEELEYILFEGYQLPPLTCIVDLKTGDKNGQ